MSSRRGSAQANPEEVIAELGAQLARVKLSYEGERGTSAGRRAARAPVLLEAATTPGAACVAHTVRPLFLQAFIVLQSNSLIRVKR